MTKKEKVLIEKWRKRLEELYTEEEEMTDMYHQETRDYYHGRNSGLDSAMWWFEEIVERGNTD